MLRCFQCGTQTPDAELARVGDGRFCATCFRALLANDDRAPLAGDSGAPPPSSAGPRSKGQVESRCLVCEAAVQDGQGLAFLVGRLCDACATEMNRELAEAEAKASTILLDAEGQDDESTPKEPERVERFTPGTGTVVCEGCERPMPGPGSYRMIAGRRYCPACQPFYSQLEERGSVAVARGVAGTVSKNERPLSEVVPAQDVLPPDEDGHACCDCCGRPANDAVSTSGYRLCGACASSDRETALAVARVRHRNRIRAWQRALARGEDDA